MTDTITATDLRVKLKSKIASLDIEICEKKYEVTRLQDEINDLEIEHSDLLDYLTKLEDEED